MKSFLLRTFFLMNAVVFLSGFISKGKESGIKYDDGRRPIAKNGLPAQGSGLALSRGYYRGTPVGELSGWTLSLWFKLRSEKKGVLFEILTERSKGRGYRMIFNEDSLLFSDNTRKRKPWSCRIEGIRQGTWHHLAMTYDQEMGPVFYLNGEKKGQGRKGQMGHATKFDDYHFGAAVLKNNEKKYFFDGLIDDFFLFDIAFNETQIEKLINGEKFEDSLIAFNDFENVNHHKLAVYDPSFFEENYLDEGKKLYLENCTSCHSKDGLSPPLNQLSRMFTKHKMENGGDPYSMFKTLTYGYRNMMPSVQLKPDERYQVIHYIRQNIIKEKAPNLLVEIDSNYIRKMPRSQKSYHEEAKRIEDLAQSGYLRDYGNALISPVVGNVKSLNALTIDLGKETTISYDLGTMSIIGAWKGGFLDLSDTLHHKLRAGGLPSARFEVIPGRRGWRWAWGGKAENQIPDLFPKTVWPEEQIRYRGHYVFGKEIILSYSVQNRGVLESPVLEKIKKHSVIRHRMTVKSGNHPLELIILEGEPEIMGDCAIVGDSVVWLVTRNDGIQFRASQDGKLVLQVPSSLEDLRFELVLGHDENGGLRRETPSAQIIDLLPRTKGGPRRWNTIHKLKGRLETSTFQGYAMDSMEIPFSNAYNSWMRTSCLAFFPDGRMAVATLSGDIWIINGINEVLDGIKWQRFAAGLYEPLGMKVVDGVLTATTRGRIVKLHDYNQDGEADYYQAFFNEDEPSSGWHAYNFDLEIGQDGSYFYSRTGGFSQWTVPGGIVCVAPDGKSSKVMGVGMRVPNGIGRLPDGRITFADNQGTYVPASKISITHFNAFHGAGSWFMHGDKYDPEKIVQPIVYMPQELDSSSGAQLWVPQDARLGPLSGQYFHTSYGRAATMYVMLDHLEKTTQGAVYRLPLKMESGTMRVAKNPIDGQLYFSGLTGWQAGATREGSIQRLRFTGEKGVYLKDVKAREGRIELAFTSSIDPDSINHNSFTATAWNYRWSKEYGSPPYNFSKPETKGKDEWKIEKMELCEGSRKLILTIPELQICNNLKLDFHIRARNGGEFSGPVYLTIHQLPKS